MNIITASNGKKVLTITRKEWEDIGKKAGYVEAASLQIAQPEEKESGGKPSGEKSKLMQMESGGPGGGNCPKCKQPYPKMPPHLEKVCPKCGYTPKEHEGFAPPSKPKLGPAPTEA